MIECMKFITIAGPKNDFDRVVFKYLLHYEIHYVSALNQLLSSTKAVPFSEDSPYSDALKQVESLLSYLDTNQSDLKLMEASEAIQFIAQLNLQIEKYLLPIQQLTQSEEQNNRILDNLRPFLSLDVNLNSLSHLKHVKYRLGRFSKVSYQTFCKQVEDNISTIFSPCYEDSSYVYGVCFLSEDETERMDALYESLQFHPILVPFDFQGTPQEAYYYYQNQTEHQKKQRKQQENNLLSILYAKRLDILSAYKTLSLHEQCFQLRKYAACICTSSAAEELYTICGFIAERDIGHLAYDLQTDSQVHFTLEAADTSISPTPTRLRNFSIFRSFESLIAQSQLPAYGSKDPTLPFALSFALIFGILFGDMFHGILLFLLGSFFSIRHKKQPGDILILCGLSSFIIGSISGRFANTYVYSDVVFFPLNSLHFPIQCLSVGLLTGFLFQIFFLLQLLKKHVSIRILPLVGYLYSCSLTFTTCLLFFSESAWANLKFLIFFLGFSMIPIVKPRSFASSKLRLFGYYTFYALLQAGMYSIFLSFYQITSTIPGILFFLIFHLMTVFLEFGYLMIQLYWFQYDTLFYSLLKESGIPFQSYHKKEEIL